MVRLEALGEAASGIATVRVRHSAFRHHLRNQRVDVLTHSDRNGRRNRTSPYRGSHYPGAIAPVEGYPEYSRSQTFRRSGEHKVNQNATLHVVEALGGFHLQE